MADKKPEILGATAFKPVERHGWEAIKYFIHNPETGEYFTRTPKSWLLIFIFYVIYYSCLAAFWAGMLAIFLTTLSDDAPKWQHEDSIIGTSPGLGLKPGQAPKFIDSSMISFNKESRDDSDAMQGFGGWIERYAKFLEEYKDDKQATAATDCNDANPAAEGRVCKFELSTLGTCGNEKYGYDAGSPCIVLKLNKIYGLKLKAYEGADISEDKGMSKELVEHIKKQPDQNQVWVECKGENPADIEALKGKIEYFPKSQGFPTYYFPYLNQDNYKSPLVAVQFKDVPKNQLVHIECRAFAQGIGYNRRDRIGINHLELYVTDNAGASKIES